MQAMAHPYGHGGLATNNTGKTMILQDVSYLLYFISISLIYLSVRHPIPHFIPNSCIYQKVS